MSCTEKLLQFQFPAKAEALCTMRSQLRAAVEPCCKSPEYINYVVLAVGEACMNIIQHAYGKEDGGDIIVELERSDSNMTFIITDFAHRKSKFEEMKSRPLNEIRPGGLGCHIINEIMDEVCLIECPEQGNILQMKKKLED